MKDYLVTIPYEDFIDGVQAMADLDSIRAMLEKGGAYASDDILAVLGMPIKEETDA